MGEENIHINYTAHDIERYVQGKMSAKEMHDIEKAALKDPFLSDAIEGYTGISFQESNAHLNEITALLQNKKEETKVVPLTTKRFYWARVAAMVVTVIAIGAITWYIIGSNKSDDTAAVKQNETINDTISAKANPEIEKSDTATLTIAENKTNATKSETKQNLNIQKAKQTTATALNNAIKSETAFEGERTDSSLHNAPGIETTKAPARIFFDTVKLSSNANADALLDKIYPLSKSNALNIFNGRVTDSNQQPIPYATITAANKQATTTDANGYFKLQSRDSMLDVTVSSVGYVAEKAALKSDGENYIAIQQDKNVLNDVVTTGLGASKNREKRADSVYPVGGWESFHAYVYKRLKKPADTIKASQITGQVDLEFLVDENGEPYNISVIKSSNEESASKAIELIEQGPKWITTRKSRKGKVTIQF